MGICYIIGAGDFGSGTVAASEGDYIIAGDGGYRLCKERGIQPDLVVGDFDSLGYRPDHPNVRSFRPETLRDFRRNRGTSLAYHGEYTAAGRAGIRRL